MKEKIIDAIITIDNFLYRYDLKKEDEESLQLLLDDCKKRYKFEKRKCICKNCGKPFIAYNKINTLYCDRISPQNPAKNCKQYGKEIKWLERTRDEKDWYSLYRRIYNRLYRRVERHSEMKKDFDDFKIKTDNWKQLIKDSKKTEEEFMEWLQEFEKI